MVVDRNTESPHETWTESEDKVREMDHRKIKVDSGHRTGKPTAGPGDRPRWQAQVAGPGDRPRWQAQVTGPGGRPR
jgi:hypothetical protein